MRYGFEQFLNIRSAYLPTFFPDGQALAVTFSGATTNPDLWLVESGYSRPRRIAVMGGSYGGLMVLAAITTYPDMWGAAAELYGIANFETFLANTGPWRLKHRSAEYGDPERDAGLLRRISPIHNVDRITTPLIVVHGANDPRVPISETEQIVDALRARQRTMEYIRFENEGHGIVKRHNRIRTYTTIADFLDRHIMEEGVA